MKKIDYSKRGPLIKVQIGPGRFVKMYERDAIARGLVKKERPQAVNKMLVPDEEKSPITPPQPTPQAGREMTSPQPSGIPLTPDPQPSGASLPSGSSSPEGEGVEGKKGKRKKTPHPSPLPLGEGDDPTPTLPSRGEEVPLTTGPLTNGEGELEE